MKTVFVLGAGASRASVGTPLGPELVWNYHQDCCLAEQVIGGVPVGISSKFHNYRKFLVLAEREFPELGGIVKQWDDKGIYIYNPPPLEKRHYVDELLKLLQHKQDEQATSLLRQLSFEHIVGAPIDGKNDLYERFKADVLAKMPNKEVSIISFNFDSYLNQRPPGVTFDYLLDFDWREPNRRRCTPSQAAIPLIKLNGSFDWGICSQSGHLNLLHYFLRSDFYSHAKCNVEGCREALEPLIILPHQDQGSKLNRLWTTAEEHLSNAEQVVIIGYSFPPYDGKVIELFQRHLKRDVKLQVVDSITPDKNSEEALNKLRSKYKNLFPCLDGTEIHINAGGFEDYLSK